MVITLDLETFLARDQCQEVTEYTDVCNIDTSNRYIRLGNIVIEISEGIDIKSIRKKTILRRTQPL